MTETAEQYVARILGNLGDEEPITVLSKTPVTLNILLANRQETALIKRPSPERWSVAEILAHLSEVELMIAVRVRMILENNGTPIQAFDQDEWAKRYPGIPVAASLDLHRAVRKANMALYRSLSPEQMQRYGMHVERGMETIAHIIRLQAGHDLNHLRQIEGILEA